MARFVAIALQVLLLLLIAYNAITALWGWRNRRPASRGERLRILRVVIPAHNEESVIEGVLADLGDSDYTPSHLRLWVLVDRCTDRTSELATEAGALVAERQDGPTGKGSALAWYLREHPLDPDESLIVFDADNRVGSDVLGRISDELDAGHSAIQCYVDPANPGSSLIARASALSYWAGNRMVQLARSNLGWSADLGGTGMAFTSELLDQVGGFTESLTEDQELGARIVLAGHRIEWLHDLKIKDEKPTSVHVTVRQRARWMSGRRATRRAYFSRLMRAGTPASVDQALRLIQPGRTFIAFLSGAMTLLAAFTNSTHLLPWSVWCIASVVQVLEPVPFLARDQVPRRYFLSYPLLMVLAVLWLPIRVLSHRVSSWYHTPHGP